MNDLFDYETGMTPIVVGWLKEQGFTVMTERFLANGRADIVGVEFDDEKCQRRIHACDVTSWGATWRCSQHLLDPPQWYPCHRRIWAIELKLYDWQSAVSQAVTYTRAATQSFVALPRDILTDVIFNRMIETCEFHGIGILQVDQKGVIKVKDADFCPKRFWAADVINMVEKAWDLWRSENT